MGFVPFKKRKRSIGVSPRLRNGFGLYCSGYARVDGVGHFEWNRQSQRVIEKCGFRYLTSTKYETRYGTTETTMDYVLYHPERRENHVNA